MLIFQMPPPGRKALSMLELVPSWLAWGRKAVARWAAGTRYTVEPAGLRIHGTLYGRRVPSAALLDRGSRARRIDAAAESRVAPVKRTNGIGLPGYLAGWGRRADGEKVLAFVTDRERLVEVPTTRGYTLLLSVDRPEEFIAALERIPV